MQRFDAELVEAVQTQPCLYNTTLSSYKNPFLRNVAWTAVSDDLKRKGCKCTSENARRRFSHLKKKFQKEKMRQQGVRSGGGPVETSFPHYNRMCFLLPHAADGRRGSAQAAFKVESDENNVPEEKSVFSQSAPSIPSPSPKVAPKRRRKKKVVPEAPQEMRDPEMKSQEDQPSADPRLCGVVQTMNGLATALNDEQCKKFQNILQSYVCKAFQEVVAGPSTSGAVFSQPNTYLPHGSPKLEPISPPSE